MATQRAIALRNRFINATENEFEALTFGELKVGDSFITFPDPGDNSGHGGFKVLYSQNLHFGFIYFFDIIKYITYLISRILLTSIIPFVRINENYFFQIMKILEYL